MKEENIIDVADTIIIFSVSKINGEITENFINMDDFSKSYLNEDMFQITTEQLTDLIY